MQITAGKLLLIQLDERAIAHRLIDQILPLVRGAVAPIDLIGLSEGDALIEPLSHDLIHHRLGRGLMNLAGRGGGRILKLLCHAAFS